MTGINMKICIPAKNVAIIWVAAATNRNILHMIRTCFLRLQNKRRRSWREWEREMDEQWEDLQASDYFQSLSYIVFESMTAIMRLWCRMLVVIPIVGIHTWWNHDSLEAVHICASHGFAERKRGGKRKEEKVTQKSNWTEMAEKQQMDGEH